MKSIFDIMEKIEVKTERCSKDDRYIFIRIAIRDTLYGPVYLYDTILKKFEHVVLMKRKISGSEVVAIYEANDNKTYYATKVDKEVVRGCIGVIIDTDAVMKELTDNIEYTEKLIEKSYIDNLL